MMKHEKTKLKAIIKEKISKKKNLVYLQVPKQKKNIFSHFIRFSKFSEYILI